MTGGVGGTGGGTTLFFAVAAGPTGLLPSPGMEAVSRPPWRHFLCCNASVCVGAAFMAHRTCRRWCPGCRGFPHALQGGAETGNVRVRGFHPGVGIRAVWNPHLLDLLMLSMVALLAQLVNPHSRCGTKCLVSGSLSTKKSANYDKSSHK